MLYFFSGSDSNKRMREVETLTAALYKKYPSHLDLTRTDVDLGRDELLSLLVSTSLFDEVLIVRFSNTLSQSFVRTSLEEHIDRFAASPHHFIFVDEEVPADSAEIVSKKAEIFSISNLPKKATEYYNAFLLSDGFGKRDKKGAWLLYREAIRRGSDPREIHGMLFWIVKAMLVAKPEAVSAEDSGLSPFVFKKAKTFARNFSLIELQGLLGTLVALLHDSMRQGTDLETDLELFILKSL